jgi:hypothetical protein
MAREKVTRLVMKLLSRKEMWRGGTVAATVMMEKRRLVPEHT